MKSLAVLVISYQRPAFLKTTLETLIKNNDVGADIFVADNATNPETQAVIEQFDVQTWFLPENHGINHVVEKIFAPEVEHEFVMICDHDLYFNAPLSKYVNFLKARPFFGAAKGLDAPEHTSFGFEYFEGDRWEMKFAERGAGIVLSAERLRQAFPLPTQFLNFDTHLNKKLEAWGLKVGVLPKGVIHLGWKDSTWGNECEEKWILEKGEIVACNCTGKKRQIRSDPKHVSVRFMHGLGDCANFAFQIPLYTARGYRVDVECTPDKAPIFKAAGANVVGSAPSEHPWSHQHFGATNYGNPADQNKAGWNLSKNPMPHIGHPQDLWQEYKDVKLQIDVPPMYQLDKRNAPVITDRPKPWFLFHSMANTSPESKNLPAEVQMEAIHELLDRTGGSVFVLDWDSRAVTVENHRCCSLIGIGTWNVYEIIEAMNNAAVMIGVDSGPLHLARFTNVPTLGIWQRHYPAHFILPRDKTLNLMPPHFAGGDDRYRRHEFHTIPTEITGKTIADYALRLLEKPRWLGEIAPDLVLQHYLSRTRSRHGQLSNYIDRHKSFGIVMDHLASKEKPVICETGCIRADEDWGGAGYSTYLFAWLLHQLGKGEMYSVDLNHANVKYATDMCVPFRDRIRHYCKDSLQFLRELDASLDVFYADSVDVGEPGFEQHCLEEVKLAVPKLKPDGMVLIDDTVKTGPHAVRGKGARACHWLEEQGFKLIHAGYQLLYQRKV